MRLAGHNLDYASCGPALTRRRGARRRCQDTRIGHPGPVARAEAVGRNLRTWKTDSAPPPRPDNSSTELATYEENVMISTYKASPDIDVLSSTFPIPGFGLIPLNAFVLDGPEPVLVDTGAIVESDEFMAALRT